MGCESPWGYRSLVRLALSVAHACGPGTYCLPANHRYSSFFSSLLVSKRTPSQCAVAVPWALGLLSAFLFLPGHLPATAVGKSQVGLAHHHRFHRCGPKDDPFLCSNDTSLQYLGEELGNVRHRRCRMVYFRFKSPPHRREQLPLCPASADSPAWNPISPPSPHPSCGQLTPLSRKPTGLSERVSVLQQNSMQWHTSE